MSSVYRFLSFVPPTLFFVLPLFSQVQGKLEQIPGSNTFQVSIISTVDWSPPESVTSSAQLTMRATAGKLEVTNVQNQNGVWSLDTPVTEPAEAPGYDYFSFYLSTPMSTLDLVSGQEIPLFSFENNGGCVYVEIVDNSSDPFMPPNSMSVNIGNTFSMAGAPGQNAYEGNSAEVAVECPPLSLNFIPANNPVPCFGDATSVTIEAVGGVEPYSVYWEGLTTGGFGTNPINDFEGSTSFANFFGGTYRLTIIDALDSAYQVEVEILQPDLLEIEVTGDPASCNGSMDGQAFVSDVDGGTALVDYQYYWNTNPTVSSQSIGFLDPGTYSVTVVDDNGCSAEESVSISTFGLIFLNEELSDISCFGANDGVIDLYPVSLNGPFEFEWSSNVFTGNFSSAWQLSAGTYSVTVTDNTGICSETATFEIAEPEQIEVDYRMTEPECYGDDGYVDILAVSNAIEPWHAEIIGNAMEVVPNTFAVDAGVPMRLIVTDTNGCEISEDFLIPGKQELFVELGADLSIKYGEKVRLQADIFPNQNVELQWSPSTGLSCDDCLEPEVLTFESTSYRLQLIDSSGCVAEDQISIAVNKSRDIFIPNAFSPNYDGINDTFCPFGGFGVVSIQSMQVFDRWGGLVYSKREAFDPKAEPKAGWDGTAQGKPVDPGTYLYTMNVEFIDGEVILYSGEVNLMR